LSLPGWLASERRTALSEIDSVTGRKHFFLKKEAKTFARKGARCCSNALKTESFLVLFFKKELLPSCLRAQKKGASRLPSSWA
jgi:hypothetical protein